MQIVMAMDVDQRTELQSMIYDLEEENRFYIVLYVFKYVKVFWLVGGILFIMSSVWYLYPHITFMVVS